MVQVVVNWRLKGVHVVHYLSELGVGVVQLIIWIYWTLEIFVSEALVEEVKDVSKALKDLLDSVLGHAISFIVDESCEVLVHSLNHLHFGWECSSILIT